MIYRKKDYLTAFCLVILIFTSAILVTVFFKPLFYFDIKYLQLSKITGLSAKVIKNNYDQLIAYQSIFYQKQLVLPNFPISQTGRIHFLEVKRILEGIQLVFLISLIPTIYLVYSSIREREYRFLKLTYLFIGGFGVLIGLSLFAGFNNLFILFHNLVFRNDYWIFDYRTDPVILILPNSYFRHCFILIVVIIIFAGVICFFSYQKKKSLMVMNSDV